MGNLKFPSRKEVVSSYKSNKRSKTDWYNAPTSEPEKRKIRKSMRKAIFK